jgi:hypothetical protein
MKGFSAAGWLGGLVGFLRLWWRPAGRGRGMGHVRVVCTSSHDEFRQMVFLEPPHHRGTGRLPAGSPDPALSVTTPASGTATADA